MLKSGGNEQSPFFDSESVVVDAKTVPVTTERFHVPVGIDLLFWPSGFDDGSFQLFIFLVLVSPELQQTFISQWRGYVVEVQSFEQINSCDHFGGEVAVFVVNDVVLSGLSVGDSGQNIGFFVVGALDPHGVKLFENCETVKSLALSRCRRLFSISGKVYLFKMEISAA
jgi:hypothetical protein